MQKGTIRCQWCHVRMDDARGVCPKCGKATCYIAWYDERTKKHRRIFDDKPGVKLGYNAALDKLLDINRQYRDASKDGSTTAFDISRYTDPGDHLVRAILPLWLDAKQEESRQGRFSPGSLHTYESYSRNYFAPVLGQVPIYALDTEHYELLLKGIPEGRKLKYRKNVLFAFRAFLRWARKNKKLRKDIPELPEITGDDSEPTQALEVHEQETGLQNIPERHRDIFEFGFETGLRSGSLATLRILDINVFDRRATVRRTESDRKVWEYTKGRKVKKKELSARAMELAASHIRGRENLDDWLFINPDTGRRYTVQTIWRIWRRHSGTSIPPHQAVRHSYATQYAEIIAELGLPEHYLQELMDHADPRTTRRYTHIRESVMKDLVNQRQNIVQLKAKK